MFDIEKARNEAKIPKTQFQKIVKEVKKEFPDNQMLFELHVIRYIDSLSRKDQRTK